MQHLQRTFARMRSPSPPPASSLSFTLIMHVSQFSRICAFTSALPLPSHQVNVRTSPCICMKTKRGTTGQKKVAKNKRATPSGFGPATTPVEPKNESTEPAENEFDQTDPNQVQFEKPSGAAGDATPHRALVPGLASATMTNPEREALGPDSELAHLPELSEDETEALRFPRVDLDKTIELFADAKEDGRLAEVVVANRDLVTEKVLYRYTSAILQVESRETNLETRDEEVRNMRALRNELIAHCWSNDFPLKKELQLAEVRLLPVLQGNHVKRDVRRNCGVNNLEVDAFWIVIFAAIAAWEEKGKENPKLINVDIQRQLTAAAEACEEVDEVLDKLSPSLKAVQKILSSSDPMVQAKIVEDLDDKTVNHIGSLTEQIRLFPTAAYGGLTRKMDAIMDYILKAKYNFDSPELIPFRFELSPIERASRLVNIGRQSLEVNKRRTRKRWWRR